MADTIIKFVFIGALCVSMVVVLIITVCEIIDYTRKVEDPIGSLTDEEKDREDAK